MSFRINYNPGGVLAHRNAARSEEMLTQSVARLSSGLRINSIREDVPGLLTSEGLRTRLANLEAASRNVQDSINLAKLGDAALGEAASQLIALRSLAIAAANSATVSSTQLSAMQEEFKQGLEAMDRIARQTTWGDKRLLDGSAGSRTTLVTSGVADFASFTGLVFNRPVLSGIVTLTQTVRATKAEIATDIVFASPAAIPAAGTILINGVAVTADGVSEDVDALVRKINERAMETGVVAEIRTVPATTVALVAREYGSRHPINLIDTSGVISSTPSGSFVAGIDARADVEVRTPAGVQILNFVGAQGGTADGLLLTDNQGNQIRLNAAGNDAFTVPTAVHFADFARASDVRLQAGDGAFDGAMMGLADIRADQLGIGAVPGKTLRDIDLASAGGPAEALTLVDAALAEVNAARARLGSTVKANLESIQQTNLSVIEGLTTRNSAIIDADLALEMTGYTRHQMLQQAALSILGQSNQRAGEVLRLLQS